MRKLLLLGLGMAGLSLFAQSKFEQDKATILKQCGCFEVDFHFAETFAENEDYELKKPYHTSAPAEWVFVAEETDSTMALQHILVIGDSMIVKHWRQDWKYQESDMLSYVSTNKWKKEKIAEDYVDGYWTQSVYQVDDSPRYSGYGQWITTNGTTYWESNSDSPLPRREYTKRNDYNVLNRTNRVVVTDDQWIHYSTSKKINRGKFGKEELIVEEAGRNTYTRIKDKKCQAGMDWWKKNEVFWATVRSAWDDVYGGTKKLEFKSDKKSPLFMKLYSMMGQENADKLTKDDILAAIEPYIK